ncbi:MAG: FAD-dependent oxidoreductase [Thermoflexales bacterium]
MNQVVNTLSKLGARHEVLSAAQFGERFAQFRIGPDGYAVYSPDAGILLADQCVQAMAHMAVRYGSTIHESEVVSRVHSDGDSVEVITNRDRYRARKAIVTAGAWVNQLLAASGYPILPVRIEREQVAYFNARGDRSLSFGQWPIWIHYRRQIAYGFPDLGNGVKVGFHHAGHYINHPDENCGVLDDGDLQALSTYIRERFPDVDPTPRNGLTCLYTVTPDEDFIIDALPHSPSIIVASPCSGHGFKFAVGIGRALADLALHGTTAMSIAHTRKLAAAC